ncbi:P-loop containing nucleoside triphosphate hydrolase protein [Obelidium mucronatum]|nr:P-loop containing nucleoside triphosphate hydrolase protein [Obelidium mucronatum]
MSDANPEGKKIPRLVRRQDAPFFIRWTYSYVNEAIKRGEKTQLDESDWPLNNDEDDAERLSATLLTAWHKEVNYRKEKASLAWVTLNVNRNLTLAATFFFLLEEAVLLTSASFLSKLLIWFQNPVAEYSEGFTYCTVLSLCAITVAILHHVSWWMTNRLGAQLRIAFISAIYKKCMKLSISHTSSSGYIVNLVANDVNRFEEAANFFLFILIGPFLLVIVTFLLYQQIENAAFVASGVTLLVIPVQGFVSKMFGVYRRATVEPRDSRLKYVSDMLNGIMMVKLYAWEKPLMDNVDNLRKQEVAMMWKASILRAINLAFYQTFSCIIELFAFGSFYLMGGVLTPSKVFTTVVLLQSLKWNMGFRFPMGLQFSIESLVSFRRIQKFLLLPEIESTTSNNGDHQAIHPSKILTLQNASFTWPISPLAAPTDTKQPKGDPTFMQTDRATTAPAPRSILKDISLSLDKFQMTVLIGPVGSGKSSLLNAILREMECVAGSIQTAPNTRIAYASQTPWILSGSIQENILFGSPLDAQKLTRVIKSCALTRDLEIFEHGLETLVGERGVTLSGGQKARLALARACYSDADLYLLDDPLSAVDAKVGRQLFNDCINGLLKDKARILVTHQLQYVKGADNVVLLENGEIKAVGKYEIVMNTESSFSTLMKEFTEQKGEEGSEMLGASSLSKQEIAKDIVIEDETAKKGAPTEFVKEEAAKGTVDLAVYRDYFRAGSSWFSITVLVCALVLGNILLIITDWWLGQWSGQNNQDQHDPKWGWAFLVLAVVSVSIVVARSLLFFMLCVKSSLKLSQEVVKSVFNAEMRFFIENPAGRIMNRMSSDLNRVDENLPWTLFDFAVALLSALSTIILACTILPIVLVIIPPMGYIFWKIRKLYVTTSRQVKREEAITRSPVYATIPATLEGLSTVRAFGAEARFLQNFMELQNNNTRISILYLTIGRWLGMRLDVISATFLAIVVFTTVAVSRVTALQLSGANVGLILTYSLNLVGSLQWAFRQSAEAENLMTSAERVLEYTKIPAEPGPDEPVITPPENWPSRGEIEFKSLSLRYPPSEKNVLNNVSVKIPAGSTVGIVGRTGAGKSSLLQALFRLVQPSGTITIDSLPTSQIPLHTLRSSISIIPQDPFCFRGTLRFNLDPTLSQSDSDLWAALSAVQLETQVSLLPGKLDSFVSENGGNWSVGERQLICLARAILRKSRVFVMDEATSNVDLNTDALIGRVLRDRGGVFYGATTLTIAHRLVWHFLLSFPSMF